MQGKALYKRSTFFVDVTNVVLYVDLFLYYELLIRMKQDACLQYYFSDKISRLPKNYNHRADNNLVTIFAKKTHQNILEDWIDKETFLQTNDEDSYREYISFLYYDMLTNPLTDEYIQTTEFGTALKLLTKDEKINKIIFYIPFHSDVVIDNLTELFSGYGANKMEVAIGGKVTGWKAPMADSYILENVLDIDKFLRTSHTSLTEVLIPSYEFNLVEDRTEEEKMIEQITFKRLKLEEQSSEYAKKYNLSIHSIGVPI